jgi:hypothetical protein
MNRLSALALSIAALVFIGSVCAASEEFFGTWVNPDYNTETLCAKVVCNPDGTQLSFGTIDTTVVRYRGKFSITEKWTDAEGNIWYKVIATSSVGGYSETSYGLYRIRNSGATMESVGSRAEYPKELNPKHPSYNIYQRQQ